LNNVINEVSRPPGISVKLSGEKIQMSVMMRLIQPDMQKTSRISLIAILVILFFLFRSIKHGIIPLMTIIFGVLWSMGFMGFIGMNLSSMTSGVIAMIMGIGIDFGIQTVTRFRQEIAHNVPKRAMSITLSNVFMPMATTTLAALIGFRAMSLGELTIMADLGTIMSYGVAACFLAAVTVIPALLVIFEFGNNKNIKYGVD
ncbi:MAG: MMPL family transporter, partial [Gammaproteobacteria bacterium]|nr:MMPL family transporter [Gammaproteobacteria bacterium]